MSLRPDFAINYKSVPTVSVADILQRAAYNAAISGKTVVVADVSELWTKNFAILGQGRAPGVYSQVIAAETVKAGIARELGHIFPLLVCAIISIACILNNQRKRRTMVLICGTGTWAPPSTV